MKKQLQRIVSMVLVLCMVLPFLPSEVMAYFVSGMDNASQDYTGEITVLNEDGTTGTVDYDESWEEVYPYGAFVFGNYEAALTEGGEECTVTIPVYRLGGTTGRATVYVHYQPAVTQDGADSMTYAYAASGRDDLVIQVEDPQPVAQYQPVGMDHIYAGCDLNVEQGVEDGEEAAWQVISLTTDVRADGYTWQMAVVEITEDGEISMLQGWTDLDDSHDPELQVADDIWFDEDVYYDFRCLYTVDGKTYCTATALELPFEEDVEELEEMPADIELNAEPTYTVLNFEDEYDDCVFPLTFAENEWVKNIIVTVRDDDIPELPEMGLFTLVESYGGEVFDAANTLTLLVNDNDPHEPSQLGFEATYVEADQDSGSVTVTVERTGGTTYPVSVEYTTVNGTAEAGKQFSTSSGTLLFAGDVTSIDISIPLVAEEERTEELEFYVVLSDLKGGGENYICTLEEDTVTVALTSSGAAVGLGAGLNLASVLATASGEDVSAGSTVGEALLPESATVTGEQDTAAVPEIVGKYVAGSGNSRTYNYQSGVQLRRGTSYSGYWTTWENAVGGSINNDASCNINYYNQFTTPTFVDSKTTPSRAIVWNDDGTYVTIEKPYKVFNHDATQIGIWHNNTTDRGSLLDIDKGSYLFSRATWLAEWLSIGITTDKRSSDKYIYVMPYVSLQSNSGSGYAELKSWKGNCGTIPESGSPARDRYLTASQDIDLSKGDLRFCVELSANYNNGTTAPGSGVSENDSSVGTKNSSGVILTNLCFERRVFTNTGTIGLTVHTANDSDLEMAAAFARLDDSTGVYDSMKPTVSLVKGESGVTTDGNLYVGSKLQINLGSTASYFAALGNNASYGLYLTNSKGEKKNVTVTQGTGNVYYMTLLWDGMTAADLSDTYTINVVMERRQTVTLDISPSLGTNADEKAILAMWKKMTEDRDISTKFFITYGYSATASTTDENGENLSHFLYQGSGNYAGFWQLQPAMPTAQKMTFGQSATETFTNLQWINFNQDPEDIILFNGKSYAGNETIYLSMADLATSELIFYYYNKDTLSLPSTMAASIAETALYYDGNGNGRIDGYFNAETGYFVVDAASGDKNLGFVSGGFDETAFQPVVTKDANGNDVVHQYFLKTYYTMNPRSYQAPAGASATDTAMVLPMLASTVTDSKAFSELTAQQQSYRYLKAGATRTDESVTAYTDSSRGHLMYGAAATARSYVDIPLGGDKSPVTCEQTTTVDGVQTRVYSWEPNYYGNLLVDFADPEPINHEKNITGRTVAIAGEEPTWTTVDKKRVMTLTDAGKKKLNAYLGAMTGDTTFGLAVQETIAQATPYAKVTSLDQLDPESITLGNVKAIPNGEYLANVEGSGDPGEANGGSGGNSSMSEFEVDLGVNLPSTDIPLGDYATIIMDGSSVGFSIGLPVLALDNSPEKDENGNAVVNDNALADSFKDANESMSVLKDFMSAVKNKNGLAKFKDIMGDKNYNAAKNGGGRGVKSKNFEVSMSVALSILFEYNPIDNGFYFKQASLAATVGFEFTMQYRFTLVPILYIYLKTGFEVELATGFSVARTAKEGSKIATSDWLSGAEDITSKGLGVTLAKGESACFVVDISEVRGFHLYMDGSVYMEILGAAQVSAYKKDPNGYSGKYLASGRISSDGDEPVEVFLEEGNYRAYVVLTALETTKVYSAVEVTGAQSLVYWDGLQFAPSGFIEVGAGVGVELLKFELYLRATMGMSISIGGYSEESGKYEGAKMNSFDFSASLGFNVTVLFINYSMDLIGYYLHIEHDGAGRRVESKWGAFGGALGGDTRSAGASSGGSLVGVSAPTDTADTQRVAGEGSNSRAYDPTDDNAPFQLSGYGTSGDGFKLMDGLSTGNSYQVFRVGKDNYILYTRSRESAANALDTPQLVLSKVILTGNDNATRLQSPVGSGTCLAVDDDDTGDLDYSYSVNGSTLTVIWTSYAEASDADEDATDAAAASRRTVVKTAGIDLSEDSGFSEPQVLTDGTGDFRYLPQQEGAVSIYAEGSGEDNQNAGLKAYLMAVYGMTAGEAETGTTEKYEHAAAVYRWNYQSDLNAMYGSANRLVAVMDGKKAEAQLSTGEVIENIETATVDGTTYVAYSTVQYAYFDKNSRTTTAIDASCDLAAIKRLYLRTLDDSGWGTAKLLRTAIDFDRCDSNGAFCLKDGIYSGGSLETEQLDPYFSNLKFLNAKLSASSDAETVFLYEMGGNTYLMEEAEIIGAAAGDTFTVMPLFAATEGSDAVIGSDDAGNLAVVYTAPMNATGSNALYVAWWDTQLNRWGTGNMLAMNHLQVYEDGTKYGLSAEELELAYLGQKTGNAGYDDYISSLDADAKASAVGAPEQLTFSNLQITVYSGGEDSGEQLLVMTQGSLQELTYSDITYDYTEDDEDGTSSDYTEYGVVVPYGAPDMGFYAVSFGAGRQGVGQASLSLVDHDFTAGSKLMGTLSFVNTGTTAIRASNTEPATVTLTVSGDGSYSQTIAQWSITDSVPSGGSVELDFTMTAPLTADLPEGAVFSAVIAEDDTYISQSGGTAFSASTGELLKVEARPELQFEGFSMDLTGISGDNAVFELDMWVSDRGNVDAENIFVQFSYEKESEEAGAVEYAPLDITGSSLKVDDQIAVTRGVTADDAEHGIVYVGDISKGYQRRIHGTLSVPVSAFRQDSISGLHLKAEIFSDADNLSQSSGLYSSSHSGEYSASNNIRTQEIGHETFFSAPKRISLALGSTLRLPIGCASSSATGAEINVKEISDGTDDWVANLGILYYDAASGTVVAAPSAGTAGRTGIIQVEDLATGSIYSITYQITQLADGINIYKDDESFTFYNADKTETDVTSKTQDWSFYEDVPSWEGGTAGNETPMNGDTVYAEKTGAYLTFQTTADTMTLWFMGEVTVSSSLGTEVTGDSETLKTGGKYPLVIDFNNDAGAAHTVTVTAKAGTVLDRYTATYVDYPIRTDENGPQIFWSRSFPDTASMEPGESVTLTCYVVDDSLLKEVGGIPADTVITKTSDRFWSFDLTVAENDLFTVKATDASGKTTSYPLRVDWFNSPVSFGTVAMAPDFAAANVAVQQADGTPVTGPLAANAFPYVHSNYTLKAGETVTVMSGDGTTTITPETDGRWKLTQNGVYLVRVTAADGSWAQAVLIIDCIDDGTFTVSAADDATSKKLTVTVGKSDTDTLTALTVNGYSILESGAPYTFAYTLGGDYTVSATNSQGRTVSTTVTAGVALTLADSAVTAADCTGYGVADGTVTVSLSGIRGGSYDPDASQPGQNRYWANYTAALLPVSGADAEPDPAVLAAADWASPGDGKFTFAGLGHSWYRAVIRDSRGNTVTGDAVYISGGLALTVTDDAETRTLTVTVDSYEALTALTVNGYSILETGAPYTFAYTLGGDYTVTATDSQGRTVTATVTAEVALTLDDGAITVTTGTDYGAADDTVTVKYSGIQGGSYDPAASQPGQNRYQATYTATLLPVSGSQAEPGAEALAQASWISADGDAYRFADLSVGWYQLIVRDSQNNRVSSNLWVRVMMTPVGSSHKVIAEQPEHGTVEITPAQPKPGQEVIVTPKPDDGYLLGDLTVTDEDGNGVELTRRADGSYAFTMPGSDVTVSATFVKRIVFLDVSPSDYYYGAVLWAVENGITTGTGDGCFSPDVECTRAQAVTFLWRAAGSPAPVSRDMRFTDVDPDGYYYDAVLWAVENGITTGTGANTFSPDLACTRAQIVTFLGRSQNASAVSAANPFGDVDGTAYYANAVLWAVENGVTTGTGANTFSPDVVCTRAQIVTFLYRSSMIG